MNLAGAALLEDVLGEGREAPVARHVDELPPPGSSERWKARGGERERGRGRERERERERRERERERGCGGRVSPMFELKETLFRSHSRKGFDSLPAGWGRKRRGAATWRPGNLHLARRRASAAASSPLSSVRMDIMTCGEAAG